MYHFMYVKLKFSKNIHKKSSIFNTSMLESTKPKREGRVAVNAKTGNHSK